MSSRKARTSNSIARSGNHDEAAHALDEIDRLLDAVADYCTIVRPAIPDFEKLQAIHTAVNATVAKLNINLPLIDEAGLGLFREFPLSETGSYHTAWQSVSIFSEERYHRWREKVRDARRRVEQIAYAQPATQFEPWPLGMSVNVAERRVQRNGRVVDLSGSSVAWEALRLLAHNHPTPLPAKALWRKDDNVDLDTVYTAISLLRRRLAPLGITIPRANSRGYVLSPASTLARF